MLLESPQVPFPWLQRSCAGSPWHGGILVTFREALGEILALSDRKRTFSFEVWGSGLFGHLSWSSLWTEGVPLVNSHSPQPRAPVPRSQTSPALGVMLSVLPLMKAAFQASKNKKIISLPSCWIYYMLTGLRAGQLPPPCTVLLNHSWEMLGSALAGEGLGRKCLFELFPICVKAIKPAHVPKPEL